MNICPLCEQEINRENLLSNLEDRLKVIELLSNEYSALIKNSNLIIDEIERITDNLNLIKPEISEHKIFDEDQKNIEDFLTQFKDFKKLYKGFEDFEIIIDKDEYLEILIRLKSFLQNLKGKSNEILKNFTLNDEENKIYDIINFLQQVDTKKKSNAKN